MHGPLILTLGCSAAALVVLGVALRRGGVFSYVGPLFVGMAVLFHGLAEVLARLTPGSGAYRLLVDRARVDDWLMWAGPAILAFVVGYLVVLRRGRSQPVDSDSETERFLDWRWCLLATIPVYLVAVQGEGFVSGSQSEGDTYFRTGVTDQFLLLGVVLTAFAIVLRFGRFMPVALCQSVALLLLGKRATVVGGLVVLCFLLARQRNPPTRRQIGTLVLVGVVGSLALSSARSVAGRENFAVGGSPMDRVGALIAGVRGLFNPAVRSELSTDYVYRFDGNAYPALLLEAQREGVNPAGLSHLRVAVDLAVPSFVNPAKKDRPEFERDEKGFLNVHYGLPANVDFLPTFLGSWLAVGGPWVLLGLSLFFGAGLGAVDRWLRGVGPARTAVAAGLAACALTYPRGFQALPVAMRGVLTLAVAVWGFHFASRLLRRAKRRPPLGVGRSGDPLLRYRRGPLAITPQGRRRQGSSKRPTISPTVH